MTTGPGDQRATAGHQSRGDPRASRADREQVIDALKAAFVQGMLTTDEFDARLGQVFASRTYAELAAVTSDLPAGLIAVQAPKPALVPPPPPVVADIKTAARMIATATVIYASMWPLAVSLPRNSEGEPQSGFALIWSSTLIWFLFLLLTGADKLTARQEAPPRTRR